MGRSLSTPDPNSGVVTLTSSAGYSAGDYVYQTASDYGPVSDTALTTGSFPITGTDKYIGSAASAAGNMTVVEHMGGSNTNGQAAAKLSNGNIVHAYVRFRDADGTNNGYPYFKITAANGTTVVSETAVLSGTNYTGTPHGVCVAALPNGNFVVCYTAEGSSTANFYPAFSIYDSSGSLVTSAERTTTAYNYPNPISFKIMPRSDSSFVLLAKAYYYRMYAWSGSASGFDATFGSSGELQIEPAAHAAMSCTVDANDYIVAGWTSTSGGQSTSFTIATYDTTGTAVATATWNTNVTWGSCTGMTTLGDGTVVFVRYKYIAAYHYDVYGHVITIDGSGNPTIGAENLLVNLEANETGSNPSNDYYPFVDVVPFGSSDVAILYCGNGNEDGVDLSTTNIWNTSYVVFDSTLTTERTSGPVEITGLVGDTGYYGMKYSAMEVGSYVRVYSYTPPAWSASNLISSSYPGICYGVFYFSINTSDYTLDVPQETSFNAGDVSGIALDGYVKSESTPTTAKFYAAASSTPSVSKSEGDVMFTPVELSDVAVKGFSMCMALMGSGNVAITYLDDSGTTGTLKKLSPTGTVLATVTSTVYSSGYDTGVATFASGNIVTAMPTGSQELTLTLYDSDLNELDSTTQTYYDSYSMAIALRSFGNGAYVALASKPTSGTGAVYVISDSGDALTVTTVETGFASYTAGVFLILPGIGNQFKLIFNNNSNYQTLQQYSQRTTSSWRKDVTTPSVNSTASVFGTYNKMLPVTYPLQTLNAPVWFWNNGTAEKTMAFADFTNTRSGNSGLYYDGPPSIPYAYNSNVLVAMTGQGDQLLIDDTMSSGLKYQRANIWNDNTGDMIEQTPVTVSEVTSGQVCQSTCPHTGTRFAVVYRQTTTNYPMFAIIDSKGSTTTGSITEGVTISDTTLTLAPSSGYVLSGVAITAASAGGSGLVQTKGAATLNTDYSASTPNTKFDFTTKTTNGVRGVVTGRNVTLED